MKHFLLIVLCCAGGVVAVKAYRAAAAPAPPGTFLRSEPEQKVTLGIPFRHNDHTIFPLASFQVDARVLGIKTYNEDREARIAPVDLALGWGPMADKKFLEGISVTQSGRFYYWQAKALSGGAEEVSRHSANMHIVPGSAEVEKVVRSANPGELISLRGRLISVHGSENWSWSSSLSRSDTGDGACEVFFVDSACVFPEPDQVVTAPAATPQQSTAPIRPISNNPPSAKNTRTVTLKSTMTVPLSFGSLTIPSGSPVTVLGEKDGKVLAAYGGHKFWLEKTAF